MSLYYIKAKYCIVFVLYCITIIELSRGDKEHHLLTLSEVSVGGHNSMPCNAEGDDHPSILSNSNDNSNSSNSLR